MVEFRPHILKWTETTEATQDHETGYIIPGASGIQLQIPCRFHLSSNGSAKTFRNEDFTEVKQVGTIRVDAGQNIPDVGMQIIVEGHFEGTVKAVYKGQLSHRIEV
ncbi:hypothetical protein [Pedobacter punctiformis]|uniref:Uncharacterized protein n=1 Tax=Pedobacter punctiformis TaxID=3004097 RepID=A0ABT4LAT2_9SPHI|nr:hypothetical protein [Pedobacter sp. HCMS5-2]MCZ4244976.1 hypothetical protein [Pedobacter sp. HCMS5-2]